VTERLFLAVPVSDALRERLRELQELSLETLRDHGITNVRPENIRNSHITVRFLGDVQQAMSAQLIDALSSRDFTLPTFNYAITSIGVFDSPRKARVLWAGLDQLDEFRALRSEVDRILATLGFESERRAFSPHLTLARFREPQDISASVEELRQLTDVCTIERYRAEEVALYSSKLSPQVATHTKRALLKLS
jgi:RNA 2',3'-cyclic 3'-phosphodiesterase